MKEGIACYQDYLRGLLDLTDNRVGDKIVPPPQVKRHDPDDPYLVVAADKGTATFSDFANAVSKEYGFWLGDAFASGGSVGYDHKAMGITARGAWESVKRHFREMGVDTQTTDFTVAGIGDMSGDVFGNGMLLSRHIKLVAVFDHRHIVLDPNPDPETSFKRARAAVQAAALDLGRLRRQADFEGRRHSFARREVDCAHAGGQGSCSAIRGRCADAGGTGQCHPQGAGRPDLQRRHRDVRKGHRRNARGGRRPCQRFAARERQRLALQGLRRGRQPGLHATGSRRVRDGGRAHQHRCDRQLRRRGHLRPRGEHQDPARDGDCRGRTHREAAQCPARRNDRRRGGARPARQRLPDAGAVRHRPDRADAAGCAGAVHAISWKRQQAQSRHRVPADRRGDRRAARQGAGPHQPRTRRAARLRQDLALRRAAGVVAAR